MLSAGLKALTPLVFGMITIVALPAHESMAQDDPTHPTSDRIPTAPGLGREIDGDLNPRQFEDRPRLGICTRDFDNGRLCAAIVTRVTPGMPATRIRVRRKRPDGSTVVGPRTTLVPGDIITWVVHPESGMECRIRNSLDLQEAIRSLPHGARFLIGGYDAGNRYRPFTAEVRFDTERVVSRPAFPDTRPDVPNSVVQEDDPAVVRPSPSFMPAAEIEPADEIETPH